MTSSQGVPVRSGGRPSRLIGRIVGFSPGPTCGGGYREGRYPVQAVGLPLGERGPGPLLLALAHGSFLEASSVSATPSWLIDGSMREANGKIGQTLTGLDEANKSLNRTNAKFDETDTRVGVIDQAIHKTPPIRQ
jgi:hypothetical protein